MGSGHGHSQTQTPPGRPGFRDAGPREARGWEPHPASLRRGRPSGGSGPVSGASDGAASGAGGPSRPQQVVLAGADRVLGDRVWGETGQVGGSVAGAQEASPFCPSMSRPVRSAVA